MGSEMCIRDSSCAQRLAALFRALDQIHLKRRHRLLLHSCRLAAVVDARHFLYRVGCTFQERGARRRLLHTAAIGLKTGCVSLVPSYMAVEHGPASTPTIVSPLLLLPQQVHYLTSHLVVIIDLSRRRRPWSDTFGSAGRRWHLPNFCRGE